MPPGSRLDQPFSDAWQRLDWVSRSPNRAATRACPPEFSSYFLSSQISNPYLSKRPIQPWKWEAADTYKNARPLEDEPMQSKCWTQRLGNTNPDRGDGPDPQSPEHSGWETGVEVAGYGPRRPNDQHQIVLDSHQHRLGNYQRRVLTYGNFYNSRDHPDRKSTRLNSSH